MTHIASRQGTGSLLSFRSSIKFQYHTVQKVGFGSNLGKITRPVAAIKSLRFALFICKVITVCCGCLIPLSWYQSVFDGWVMAEWLARWPQQCVARDVSEFLESPVPSTNMQLRKNCCMCNETYFGPLCDRRTQRASNKGQVPMGYHDHGDLYFSFSYGHVCHYTWFRRR